MVSSFLSNAALVVKEKEKTRSRDWRWDRARETALV